MISPPKAYDIVQKRTHPLPVQSLALVHAPGHCLARDIRADRDLPPTDRSAMDGYAVRAEDVARFSGKLTLVGEAAAGSVSAPPVGVGKCVSIYTGAVVPKGANTVVKVEDTDKAGDIVTVLKPVKKGANIRKRGEETAKGGVILTKGEKLDAGQIGLCASVGKTRLSVYCRPRVAVISTGTEIVDPEESAKPWQIRDSNGPTLCAALKAFSCDKIYYRIVRDNMAALRRSLGYALKKRDVVLLSGGVSVGRYDLVPQILQEIGARIHFHKVAIKPGKPVLYATIGKNQHIFGLPGNPLSALNAFHEFVLPAIRCLSGLGKEHCRPSVYLPLGETLTPKGNRLEHILVKVRPNETGPLLVPIRNRGSADLVTAIQADGVALLPRDKKKCQAGCYVEFRSWRPLS